MPRVHYLYLLDVHTLRCKTILIVKVCHEKSLRTLIDCRTILDDEISDPAAGAGGGAGEGTYVKKNPFEKNSRVTTGSGTLCSRCSGWEIVSETYPASERVAVHTYVPLKGASERGARWLLQRLVAWVC